MKQSCRENCRAGKRILLKDLEATYRISRTPIRQALRRLSERGYVTLQPHSSMRVRPLSLAEVNELYSLRKAIEPVAMAEGIRGADESVTALLDSLLGEMHVATEKEDRLTLIGLNTRFHRSMYEPSGMPHLLSIYDRLVGICERYQWTQAGAPIGGTQRRASTSRGDSERLSRQRRGTGDRFDPSPPGAGPRGDPAALELERGPGHMSEKNAGHPRDCQEFDAANRDLNAFVEVRHTAGNGPGRADPAEAGDPQFGCSCGDGGVATLGVKDNIGVEGFRLAAGLSVPVIERDATVSGTWVKWLVRQGLEIKGKTNMYELGYGAPGCGPAPAVNPWNHSLIPGGSSSGSAVAVAAGLCSVALGTDAAGSVRIPAEYCGVISYKPSGRRAWHKHGVWPGPSTLDVIGVMARDLDLLAQAVPSPDGRGEVDESTGPHVMADPGRETLCIGLLDLEGEDVDDDHAVLADEVRAWAQDSGHSAVRVRLPGLGRRVRDAIWKIFAYEYSRALESHLTEGAREALSAPSRQLLSDGPGISQEDYVDALGARRRFQRQYAEELGECHAVLTPVTPVRPYSLAWSRAFARCAESEGERSPIDLSNVEALLTKKTRYTAPINLVEYPTLTLPMRLHRDGLPVGVQIASVPENEPEMWTLARRMWHDLGTQGAPRRGGGKLYGSFADT